MQNQFLSSFVKMRASLAQKAPEPAPKKGVSSLNKVESPDLGGLTIRGIIEEKPPVREVLEFFRERAKQLSEEED
jgi:hypothetical protein